MSRELSDENCNKLLRLYEVDTTAVTTNITIFALQQLLKIAYQAGLDNEVMKAVTSIKKDSKAPK